MSVSEAPITTYLLNRVVVGNGKQAHGEVRLQLFNNDLLGLVDADERANNIGRLACSELCLSAYDLPTTDLVQRR